jgi:hypothetical protein
MAKKRRKPGGRPRTQSAAGGAVRTAEPEAPAEARPAPAQPGPRPGSSPQRTRAEKKDLARRQREEMRKRAKRAERTRQLLWLLGAAAAVAVAVFLIARPDEPATRPDALAGELTTPPPWPANAEQAAARADAIALPDHGDTLAMHEHANVQVYVRGQQVTVPVNIGIDQTTGAVESIHTHSDDGVVHIESSTVAEFTLGDFFDIWGVRFSQTCLGADCNDGDATVRVFKDGQEVTGPLRDVLLDDQSVIVVTFGTEAELPSPIPNAFDFSSVQP